MNYKPIKQPDSVRNLRQNRDEEILTLFWGISGSTETGRRLPKSELPFLSVACYKTVTLSSD